LRQQGRSSEARERDSVGRFRAVGRLEPAFHGTREQEFDQALISPTFASFEEVFSFFKARNFKCLAGLDAVALPNFCRQNNLPFGGDRRSHGR